MDSSAKLKFPMQLEKVYEPQRFEPRWAQWWVDSGIYQARYEPGRPLFSLVIPPPNVTGVLHMGHMLEHSEIDVTIRWHRMLGETTLFRVGASYQAATAWHDATPAWPRGHATARRAAGESVAWVGDHDQPSSLAWS